MKHVGNFNFCSVSSSQVCNWCQSILNLELIYGSISNLGFSLKCNLQKYLLSLHQIESRLVANYVTVNLSGYPAHFDHMTLIDSSYLINNKCNLILWTLLIWNPENIALVNLCCTTVWIFYMWTIKLWNLSNIGLLVICILSINEPGVQHNFNKLHKIPVRSKSIFNWCSAKRVIRD